MIYISLPTMPTILTPTLKYPHADLAISNSGTGGSLFRVRCNWNSKLTTLMKLAMEKTEMERDVSFKIARRGCVTW